MPKSGFIRASVIFYLKPMDLTKKVKKTLSRPSEKMYFELENHMFYVDKEHLQTFLYGMQSQNLH